MSRFWGLLASFHNHHQRQSLIPLVQIMSFRTIILLTGGNSGIGYEAAKIFFEADAAYHIVLAARTLEKATAAANSILKETPASRPTTNTLEPLALDVTSDSSIQTAMDNIKKCHGRVDLIINNAGMRNIILVFSDTEPELRAMSAEHMQGQPSTARTSAERFLCGSASIAHTTLM